MGSNQGNRGRLGTGGSCYGARVQATRRPRSFGPLLQSIPRPWRVMEHRNGIGATTPTSVVNARLHTHKQGKVTQTSVRCWAI
jgi:hypothetical protein